MDIFEQLERDEGRRRFPYVDTAGKTTIGIGHNLTDKGLTDAQVNQLLKEDVAEVSLELRQRIPWFHDLTEARQGVLLNMAFNMGVGGLLAFSKTLDFVKAGNYAQAADEMLDSKWADDVGSRAFRLSQQMRTGEWT